LNKELKSFFSNDYRLAPETKLKGIIEDIRDALNWARNEGKVLFNIDPDRIGVVSNSAGGYLTLMSGFVADYRRYLMSITCKFWLANKEPFSVICIGDLFAA
jgi:dipeptidyl aminopeptidase/acylaminoacyl peptidase